MIEVTNITITRMTIDKIGNILTQLMNKGRHLMENKNTLPPKKGSIDQLVTKPADVEKVINGQKTATRRSGRYADVGEKWTFQDKGFIVKNVYQQKLGEVTDADALMEGYQSLEEYKQSILSIHPGMKWQPEMKVWVHEYESVEKG